MLPLAAKVVLSVIVLSVEVLALGAALPSVEAVEAAAASVVAEDCDGFVGGAVAALAGVL